MGPRAHEAQGVLPGYWGSAARMAEFKDIPGNQTPDTPDLNETDLRGMQMAQLRELGRRVGLARADGMRRDELIREIGTFFRERRRQQASGGRKPETVGQRQTAGQAAGRRGAPGNQSPNTPDLSETELRRLHMPDLRNVARQEGIQGADNMRKDELILAISRRHRELHSQA
jgi:Rho termination factor, N-terminal domain